MNGSYITLTHLSQRLIWPTRLSEFRPISLLNSSVNVLTKILANWLHPLMTRLVHKNQNGFIRSSEVEPFRMFYKQLASYCWAHPTFKCIRRSTCQHKHKAFFWLLAHDRSTCTFSPTTVSCAMILLKRL